MLNKEWFQNHDVNNKLRVALETLANNQMLAVVFDGLQDGKATVEVFYNGESVSFVNVSPTLNTAKDETVKRFGEHEQTEQELVESLTPTSPPAEVSTPIEVEDTMQYEQENKPVMENISASSSTTVKRKRTKT
jgi:hypothetical protein